MAKVTSPPAPPGFGAEFNADEFRSAIRATMTMGLPNKVEERATFRWIVRKDWAQEDSGGVPFDLTSTPTRVEEHPDVQIPIAWAFSARPAQSVSTEMGEFDLGRVEMTILDVDYELVRGAELVVLGGNIYEIAFVAPPVGLFDVTVYTVYANARDET